MNKTSAPPVCHCPYPREEHPEGFIWAQPPGPPWRHVPQGGEYVWVPDHDWRLRVGGACRFGSPKNGFCRKRAVAQLRRGRGGWWNYCPDHLYGRKVTSGAIVVRVRAESPAAERGYAELRSVAS